MPHTSLTAHKLKSWLTNKDCTQTFQQRQTDCVLALFNHPNVQRIRVYTQLFYNSQWKPCLLCFSNLFKGLSLFSDSNELLPRNIN
jgi:hypothetical protein